MIRHLPWTLTALMLICLLPRSAAISHAAVVGTTSTFDTGTEGWNDGFGSGRPTRIDSGGPAGDGDSYLEVTSEGGFGPFSKLAFINEEAEWIGDYSDVSSVTLDVVNFANSDGPLALRLVLFGANNVSNRWTSVDAVTVPNDDQWHSVSFAIDEESLQRTQGSSTYEAMIGGVVRVMLRHDAGTPSATGTAIAAMTGFDNISLVGGSSLPSDFDSNGILDVNDLNLLLTEIRLGTGDLKFDRTGDGTVDLDDVVAVVTGPDDFNTYVGDANLDLEFNSGDLVALFQAGEYEDNIALNSTWSTGDWNADGEFGTGDLLFAFQIGGFEEGPRMGVQVAAVPEPCAVTLLLVGTLLCIRRRQ